MSRFQTNINEANRNMNKPYHIDFSVGRAHFDHNSELSLDDMMKQADASMYQSKRS